MEELNAGVALRRTLRPVLQTELEMGKYTRFYENIRNFATTVDVICAQKS